MGGGWRERGREHILLTMAGRKCGETGSARRTHTNTHTNKGSVKQTSRPNASPTPSPGFDGLAAITIARRSPAAQTDAHRAHVLAHALTYT